MIYGKYSQTQDKSDSFKTHSPGSSPERPQTARKASPVKLKPQLSASNKARVRLLRETLKIEERNKLNRVKERIKIIDNLWGSQTQDFKFKRPLKPKTHLAIEARSKISPIKRSSSTGRLIHRNPSENTIKVIDEKYENLLMENTADEQKYSLS
jgi:hypothetical protein